MNNNIPNAADAYRSMLVEGKPVTLTVPFLGTDEKNIMAQAAELSKKNGFAVVTGKYDRYDKAVYVTFKGDSVKLQRWVDMWSRTDAGTSVRHLGIAWDWGPMFASSDDWIDEL